MYIQSLEHWRESEREREREREGEGGRERERKREREREVGSCGKKEVHCIPLLIGTTLLSSAVDLVLFSNHGSGMSYHMLIVSVT